MSFVDFFSDFYLTCSERIEIKFNMKEKVLFIIPQEQEDYQWLRDFIRILKNNSLDKQCEFYYWNGSLTEDEEKKFEYKKKQSKHFVLLIGDSAHALPSFGDEPDGLLGGVFSNLKNGNLKLQFYILFNFKFF